MSDELSRISERVRQNREVRQTDVYAVRPPRPLVAGSVGGMFVAGDRVFDTLSGQEGDVVSATGFGSAPLGTVGVRLDGGESVTRRPSELILRPAPPVVGG